MSENSSEVRYLTPPNIELQKEKYCRFKKIKLNTSITKTRNFYLHL